MNLEVYSNILPANVQTNASTLIERNFVIQQDNGPKHTIITTKVKRKKGNPIEHEFHLQKRFSKTKLS